MVWQKGVSANPKGRPKGSLNKASAILKAALVETFDRLGGVDHMLDWASAYPSDFYRLYGKVMPVEIEGTVKSDQTRTIRIEFVEPARVENTGSVPRIIDGTEKI